MKKLVTALVLLGLLMSVQVSLHSVHFFARRNAETIGPWRFQCPEGHSVHFFLALCIYSVVMMIEVPYSPVVRNISFA